VSPVDIEGSPTYFAARALDGLDARPAGVGSPGARPPG